MSKRKPYIHIFTCLFNYAHILWLVAMVLTDTIRY